MGNGTRIGDGGMAIRHLNRFTEFSFFSSRIYENIQANSSYVRTAPFEYLEYSRGLRKSRNSLVIIVTIYSKDL